MSPVSDPGACQWAWRQDPESIAGVRSASWPRCARTVGIIALDRDHEIDVLAESGLKELEPGRLWEICRQKLQRVSIERDPLRGEQPQAPRSLR